MSDVEDVEGDATVPNLDALEERLPTPTAFDSRYEVRFSAHRSDDRPELTRGFQTSTPTPDIPDRLTVTIGEYDTHSDATDRYEGLVENTLSSYDASHREVAVTEEIFADELQAEPVGEYFAMVTTHEDAFVGIVTGEDENPFDPGILRDVFRLIV